LTLKDNTILNVFFYIHNVEIKGRALMEIYRVVPQTKRGNSWLFWELYTMHDFVF